MCVPFYTVMTAHYIICNFQKVDIYQNIRPRKRNASKPSEPTIPYASPVGVVEDRSVLMGFLMVPMDPMGHREH